MPPACHTKLGALTRSSAQSVQPRATALQRYKSGSALAAAQLLDLSGRHWPRGHSVGGSAGARRRPHARASVQGQARLRKKCRVLNCADRNPSCAAPPPFGHEKFSSTYIYGGPLLRPSVFVSTFPPCLDGWMDGEYHEEYNSYASMLNFVYITHPRTQEGK